MWPQGSTVRSVEGNVVACSLALRRRRARLFRRLCLCRLVRVRGLGLRLGLRLGLGLRLLGRLRGVRRVILGLRALSGGMGESGREQREGKGQNTKKDWLHEVPSGGGVPSAPPLSSEV